MIKAPYNFVPLSKFVFFPERVEHISHDVPFKEGISGVIECELKAESPIYVRNGGNWDNVKDIMSDSKNDSQSFFEVGGKFMIPGSSLKGMLRSVIEIASFGKIRADDRRYSIRDLKRPEIYGDHMTERVTSGGTFMGYKPKPLAGWLDRVHGRKWMITPCSYTRVEQDELIRYNPAVAKIKLRKEANSPVGKYKIWASSGVGLDVDFTCLSEKTHDRHNPKLYYSLVDEKSLKKGTKGRIILTGQPSNNDGTPHRKHMEFIFFDERKPDAFTVPDQIREEFVFVHSKENGTPNDEWMYWKDKLDTKERVPVFYLTDEKTGELKSIGLALMYRLPYDHSVHCAISHTSHVHLSPDPDLAETIFGYVRGKDALRGRVNISHALAVDAVEKDDPVTTILNGPKPTYYPNYIKQTEANPATGTVSKYKTFMDTNCEIRGWKRYPARRDGVTPIPEIPKDAKHPEMIGTKFIPLKLGTRFSFTVRVHNLRPEELGAVVWALTWGGDAGLRHSLGMGKPFGFGQVSIKIGGELESIRGEKVSLTDAMGRFTAMMKKSVSAWEYTDQMRQLRAMADPTMKPQGGSQFEKLQQMKLGRTAVDNEFQQAKSAFKYLLPHYDPKAAAPAGEPPWRDATLIKRRDSVTINGPGGKSTSILWTNDVLTRDIKKRLLKEGKITALVMVEKGRAGFKVIEIK